jgi:hypothetical protein
VIEHLGHRPRSNAHWPGSLIIGQTLSHLNSARSNRLEVLDRRCQQGPGHVAL